MSRMNQQQLDQMNALANALLQRAAESIGVSPPALYYNYRADNAFSDGRTIHYNPIWLWNTMQAFCNDQECSVSFALGVFAHELAHHVYGDAYCAGCDPHALELRADRVAGEVLARHGVSSHHFERILSSLSSRPTQSHPGGLARSCAIRRGYDSVRYSNIFSLF